MIRRCGGSRPSSRRGAALFQWFSEVDRARAYADAIAPYQRKCESYLERKQEAPGYCHACDAVTTFVVQAGALFGSQPNLREGLVCRNCGLSNRNRLLAAAIGECAWARGTRVIAFERLSGFYRYLSTRFANLVGTEYLGEDVAPGSARYIGGVQVRHESMTRTSFQDGAFDLVLHNDVLEHIFDYKSALNECFRILSDAGVLIFTTPVFIRLDSTSEIATLNSDRSITFHGEPEYHGDPISSSGALTFYHYGWSLVDSVREVGFTDVQLGINYDVFSGLVSNNHPDFDNGNMLPMVIRGRKS
jgi:SAM-dependent methyltransferase